VRGQPRLVVDDGLLDGDDPTDAALPLHGV
jgi:hypothetical protein